MSPNRKTHPKIDRISRDPEYPKKIMKKNKT